MIRSVQSQVVDHPLRYQNVNREPDDQHEARQSHNTSKEADPNVRRGTRQGNCAIKTRFIPHRTRHLRVSFVRVGKVLLVYRRLCEQHRCESEGEHVRDHRPLGDNVFDAWRVLTEIQLDFLGYFCMFLPHHTIHSRVQFQLAEIFHFLKDRLLQPGQIIILQIQTVQPG